MKERLFPERKACKKCSRKLTSIVIDGIYCSYVCANLPKPHINMEFVPRECKTERDGEWRFKKRYRYEGEVPEVLINDPSVTIYRCLHCRFLHIGHDRPLGTEKSTIIREAKDFGIFLQKTRESLGLERRDVAKKTNIPAIRIKEIEEGTVKVNLSVLFQLLRFYKLKMNILFN